MSMLPAGTYVKEYSEDVAVVHTRLQWGLTIALLALIFTFPFYASTYLLGQGILIGISLLSVLGLYIVTGLCGQISLAQSAFMAVGAYTQAIILGRVGIPFWAAIPISGLCAAVVGAIFGLPAARIKGFYLLLASIAAHFIIIFCIYSVFEDWTGGHMGISCPVPEIAGISLLSEPRFFWLTMVCVVILTLMAKNISRTRLGRALVAIRDNDKAAEAMGVNVAAYKVLAFSISAFFAGVGGALMAHYMTNVSPEAFGLMQAIWYIAMLLIGGMHSCAGAVMGTVFIEVLDEVSTTWAGPALGLLIPGAAINIAGSLSLFILGLVLCLFILFEPRGLDHIWQRFKSFYRHWPFSY